MTKITKRYDLALNLTKEVHQTKAFLLNLSAQ